MVVYADILFLNNTIMTLGIIWALSKILNYKTTWYRLMLSALAGTIYTFIVLYLRIIDISDFSRITLYLSMNIFTAVIMIYIAFGKLPLNRLIKAVGYLYIISFIVVGTILSISYIYGRIHFLENNDMIINISLGIIIILLLGKFGWGIFQNYIVPEVFLVSVKIIINEKKIKVNGLVDTGNKLKDPLNGRPVVVLELKQIRKILPECLNSKLLNNREILDYINLFKENGWGNRVRVLPFSDLGQEHGVLAGLRPDSLIITYKSKRIKVEQVILGLTERQLDENDQYQALINPQILKTKN